jgi:hypothetical protein
MAGSPQEQAETHLDLADKRVDEIARLAEGGNAAAIAGISGDIATNIRVAQASIARNAAQSATAADQKVPASGSEGSAGGSAAPSPMATADNMAPGVTSLYTPSSTPEAQVTTTQNDSTATTRNGAKTEAAQETATPTALRPGWNLVPTASDADALASLSAEDRAFVLQVQDRAARNLGRLYYLKQRASADVQASLQVAIDASAAGYREALEPYLGAAAAQWDVRWQMLQIDAFLEPHGADWRTAGRDIRISSETRILNAPTTGAAYRVSGVVLRDGAFLALFIEHGAADDNGRTNEAHVSGLYSYDPGTDTITVGGFPVLPLSSVAMQGQALPGAWVHVIGQMLPEGFAPRQMTVTALP